MHVKNLYLYLTVSGVLLTEFYTRMKDFMSTSIMQPIIVYAYVYFVVSLFDFAFVDFSVELWCCWLGLLNCENSLP